MRCIKPITINDTIFSSSTIPEPDTGDPALYNPATTYATGNQVLVTDDTDSADNHWIYTSLKDSNQGNYPPDNYTGDDPWWSKYRRSNRWRMWDDRVRSVSSRATSITVEITPGELFNAICLLGIVADSVSVTVTDPVEGEVYSNNVEMIDLTGIDDFYQWFFEPLAAKETVLLTDLPAFPAADLEVIVTNTGDIAELGEMVVGRLFVLGSAGYPYGGTIDNFNRKIEDSNGYPVIEEKGFISSLDYSFHGPTSAVYAVRSFIGQFIDIPALWIGYTLDAEDLAEESIIFGYVKSWDFNVSDMQNAAHTLQIEELA